MMHKIMQAVMGSCKEATFNISKKEEGALHLYDRTRLWIHLRFCEYCKKFEQQTKSINKASRNIHSDDYLSPLTKEKINKSLKDGYQ